MQIQYRLRFTVWENWYSFYWPMTKICYLNSKLSCFRNRTVNECSISSGLSVLPIYSDCSWSVDFEHNVLSHPFPLYLITGGRYNLMIVLKTEFDCYYIFQSNDTIFKKNGMWVRVNLVTENNTEKPHLVTSILQPPLYNDHLFWDLLYTSSYFNMITRPP